jgi:MFS family permease
LGALTAASFVAVGFGANAALIQDSFGLSHAAVGAIASAIYGAAAASSGYGGRLTDRSGPAFVLVLAMVLLSVGVTLVVIAPSSWLFFGGVLVCGLGYGAVNPPTNVLANPRTARRRGLAISGKQSGIPLGGILAGLILPFVADAAGWRLSMLIPIGLCALLAVAVVPLTVPDRDPAQDRPVPAHEAVKLRLPQAYVFGFLMAGVQVTIFTFFAVFLHEDRHMTVASAGLLLSTLMCGGLVGRPFWGWLSDRRHHDRARILQLCTALSAAGLLLLALAPEPSILVVAPLVGFCSVGWNGVYITSVAESAGTGDIGSATGAALVLVNVGAVMLPPSFGGLVAHANWQAAWGACACLAVAAAAAIQLTRQDTADTTAAAQETA